MIKFASLFIDKFFNNSSNLYYEEHKLLDGIYKVQEPSISTNNNILNIDWEDTNKYLICKNYRTVGNIELEAKTLDIDKFGFLIKETKDYYLYVSFEIYITISLKLSCYIHLRQQDKNGNIITIKTIDGQKIFEPDVEYIFTANLKCINNKMQGIIIAQEIDTGKKIYVNNTEFIIDDHVYNYYFNKSSRFGIVTNSNWYRVNYFSVSKPDFEFVSNIKQSIIKFDDPKYKIYLCDTITMNKLQDLTDTGNKSLQIVDNKPGQFTGAIDINYSEIENINPISTCILIMKNNIPVWGGPIWSINENIIENKLDVNALGWFSLLEKRKLRQDKTYTNVPCGDIIFDLLNYMNAQSGIDKNTVLPTIITPGTSLDNTLRTKSFEKGTSIAAAIQTLIDIESGCNIEIDPLTRELNVFPWDYKINQQVADNRFSHFIYKKDDSNMASITYSEDASEMVNHLLVQSEGPSGFSGDLPSQKKYTLFEDHVTISSMSVATLLAAYGEAEILYKKEPRRRYTINPFVYTKDSNVPDPLVDYNVGELCNLTIDKAPKLQLDKTRVKVQQINISIDEEGNETVQSLELYQ